MCFPGFLKCDSHMGMTLSDEQSVGVISPVGFTYLFQKTVIIWVLWNPWGLAIRTLTSGNGATMAWRPPLFFPGSCHFFFPGFSQIIYFSYLSTQESIPFFFRGARSLGLYLQKLPTAWCSGPRSAFGDMLRLLDDIQEVNESFTL